MIGSFLKKLFSGKEDAPAQSQDGSPQERLNAAISDLEQTLLGSTDPSKEALTMSDQAKTQDMGMVTPPNKPASEPAKPDPKAAQEEQELAAARQSMFEGSPPTADADAAPPTSVLGKYRDLAFGGPFATASDEDAPAGAQTAPPATSGTPDTSALNQPSVQAVEFQNQEIKDYAPTMVATPPDQMIGQAAGLAAQASAQYFDSMTKVIMASQSMMLKKMAENVASGNVLGAAEDGLVIAETELLLAGAMAVAAAGGAMEAEAASFGITKINESVQTRTAKASKG